MKIKPLTAQGRLRIPAGVLRRERWKTGTKLIVEEVAGCLAYKGVPKTDAQIRAALADRFRKV